jgi:hypothetical protein
MPVKYGLNKEAGKYEPNKGNSLMGFGQRILHGSLKNKCPLGKGI